MLGCFQLKLIALRRRGAHLTFIGALDIPVRFGVGEHEKADKNVRAPKALRVPWPIKVDAPDGASNARCDVETEF